MISGREPPGGVEEVVGEAHGRSQHRRARAGAQLSAGVGPITGQTRAPHDIRDPAGTTEPTCSGPDATLVKNLAALWAADPVLAGQIESLHPPDPYPVEPSKAGPPTVVVTPAAAADSPATAPTAGILLHSRYQPLAEAERLLKDVDIESHFVFYVHGFGLGYHVEQLFERAGKESLLFVFEPDLRLLWTALHHRDFSHLIDSRRVVFFTRADKSELFVRLTPHAALVYVRRRVGHSPAEPSGGAGVPRAVPDLADGVRVVLPHEHEHAGAQRPADRGKHRAQHRLVRRDAERRAAEGPAQGRAGGHRLGGAVAAEEQAPAEGAAGQSGHHRGADDAAAAAGDGRRAALRHVARLPRHLHAVLREAPADAARRELVAEPKATSAIFDLYPGPVTLLGNEFADGLLRGDEAATRRGCRSGATVAHLAYLPGRAPGLRPDRFRRAGPRVQRRPVLRAGTSYDDVWRPELSRFCTVEMKQWEQIVRERLILRRIPDYQGRPMYTEERLFTYLQQFERDFADSKATVIDATEGGAAKRGAEVMTLAEVIASSAVSRAAVPESDSDRSAPHPGPLPSTGRAEAGRELPASRRRGGGGRSRRSAATTLPLLEEIRDHVDDQPRVNRAISRDRRAAARG